MDKINQDNNNDNINNTNSYTVPRLLCGTDIIKVSSRVFRARQCTCAVHPWGS